MRTWGNVFPISEHQVHMICSILHVCSREQSSDGITSFSMIYNYCGSEAWIRAAATHTEAYFIPSVMLKWLILNRFWQLKPSCTSPRKVNFVHIYITGYQWTRNTSSADNSCRIGTKKKKKKDKHQVCNCILADWWLLFREKCTFETCTFQMYSVH